MACNDASVCDSAQSVKGFVSTHADVSQTPDGLFGSKPLCPSPRFSTVGGIAEALRSVANADSWSLHAVFLAAPSLFCVQEQKPQSNRLDSPAQDSDGDVDKRDINYTKDVAQEDTFEVKFESKYIKSSVPLYQEYWLKCMKEDLHKVQQKRLANLVLSRIRAGAVSSTVSSPTSITSPTTISIAPYALWQDLPEVKSVLHKLTANDIRLQEAMFELIVSEASYQKSLRVAVGLFQCSTELRNTLSSRHNHVLFSNIKEVCKVSEGFLLDLETLLGQNVVMSKVGDVVLTHNPAFRRVYVPYVTNMMYQEALIVLCSFRQENRRFAVSLKKLEKDPRCQRQSLKSFLVLPFQRITRLRLILENILKKTNGNSTDAPSLKKAIEGTREIVVECDKNVQKMKQTEELVSLGKLVDFGTVKSVPLIISGRYLMRAGPMKKLIVKSNHTTGSTVSRSDIYLHLFNDLLLLSLKNGHRFTVQDHAVFPAHVRVEELKSKTLGPNAFILHLTQNCLQAYTAVVLAAQTQSEKDTWIQLLKSQKGTMGSTNQDLLEPCIRSR